MSSIKGEALVSSIACSTESISTSGAIGNETTNHWENHLPFGCRAGTLSGVGRVGGRYPMETLTELQTVVIG